MAAPEDAAPLPRGPAVSRLETLEAIALLCGARLLIAVLRFERWRNWLGEPVGAASGNSGGSSDSDPAGQYYARVVQRALRHLPLTLKCLPQAIALHWMLHRRKRPSQIVIAVLPEAHRKGRDDLHAWVELGGQVLIGESDLPHQPLIRFAFSSHG